MQHVARARTARRKVYEEHVVETRTLLQSLVHFLLRVHAKFVPGTCLQSVLRVLAPLHG